MNKQQGKGAFDKAKGKTKELAGKLTGNRSLEAEGKIENAAGHVRTAYGDAKDEVQKGFDEDRR